MFSLLELQILNQLIFVDKISTVDPFILVEMVNNVIKFLVKYIQPALLEHHNLNIKVILKDFLAVVTHVSFLKDVRVNVLQISR